MASSPAPPPATNPSPSSMSQDDIILSLRRSLAHQMQISTALSKKHPDIFASIVASLPPPPSDDNLPNAIPPSNTADASGLAISNMGDLPPPSPRPEDKDDETSNSDFTPIPQVTEEEAGTMFADSRNMERDRFFKARIAHGIDDDKNFDTPPVNCKAEVDKADKEGGYVAVMNAMRMYPEEEGVQRRGLKLLVGYAADDEHRVTMGSLGCVDLTVTAMTTYTPSSEGVAHFGLKTLSNLSFGCEDNRAVAGVKGSDAILRAMAQYPDNAGLQGDGCGALTNISHGNDANKRSIAQRGGVESVLNAMEKFLDDPKIQKQACWSLLTIAADTVAAQRTAADGAVGALIAAMVNFPESAAIQHYASWGLLNISMGSPALAKFVVDNGGVSVAQTAVNAHQGNSDVVQKATELIKHVDPYITKIDL